MKKILLDIGSNLIALPWIILPTVLAYSGETAKSPIPLVWLVPFYMVAINIYFSKHYNSSFIIWRAVHCVLILVIGYEFTYRYISEYFINKDSIIDPWTEIILYDAFIVSVSVVIGCLLIYQIIILIKNRRSKIA